jgi:hypothetical protein
VIALDLNQSLKNQVLAGSFLQLGEFDRKVVLLAQLTVKLVFKTALANE